MQIEPWAAILSCHKDCYSHRLGIASTISLKVTAPRLILSLSLSLLLSLGKLVIADSYRPILLRTKHILIGNRGQLHIGSPDCPYKGNLTISLFGRWVLNPDQIS